MIARKMVPDYIGTWLRYDNGRLYWKYSPGGGIRAGSEAGTRLNTGYITIGFNGDRLLAHRIIYFLGTGEQPDVIDHINRDKSDNRIENLRPCTMRENRRNSPLNSNSTSGAKGVYLEPNGNWRARIQVHGKIWNVYQGPSKALAIEARRRAEKEYYASG